MPGSLLTTITGEALFNDRTGAVIFSLPLAIASGAQSPAPTEVAVLLAKEVAGGIAFGLLVGLNLLLFGLIGFELTALSSASLQYIWLGMLSIPIALISRLASVAIPIGVLGLFERFERNCITLLTWAGLRGALAVALALSLPVHSPARAPIVAATYAIAIFSTLVQATTVEPLARHLVQRGARAL